MTPSVALPPGLRVFERGWLSSNNILIGGAQSTALIDSGYSTHAPQTLALVARALADRPLDVLINTHLHSDHCGGNAALQQRYPKLKTNIPPGLSESVRNWDPEALSYAPTGQSCPRFTFDAVLQPGREMVLGDLTWQVHAAPGHDPHSVVLFEPVSQVLVSADALWERGFGVVFPELDGANAFDEVSATLDVIESLTPLAVIPGHGAPFSGVGQAIDIARRRLDVFQRQPERHIHYAVKALLMFKLLELQSVEQSALRQWAESTSFFTSIHRRHFAATDSGQWVDTLVADLVKSGVVSRIGTAIAPTQQVSKP